MNNSFQPAEPAEREELWPLVALVLFLTILLVSGALYIYQNFPLQTMTMSPPSTAALPVASHTALPVQPTLSTEEQSRLPTPRATPSNSPFERTQYVLSVMLDQASHHLAVTQTMTYINHSQESLPDLLLVVEANRWPSVFELESLNWADGQAIEGYKLAETALILPLPAPLPPGASIGLSLTYRLTLPAQPGPFGYTPHQTNLADWYPFVPPYQAGRGWLMYQAAAVGEHLAYDIADYEVDIQLIGREKDGLTIAASAPAEIEGNRYRYRQQLARNFTWSVSATYHQLQTSVGPVTINGYLFPEHLTAGQATLQATAEALALYSDLFAPYPHASFTFVEADLTDGLEYDGLYFLNRAYFEKYDGTPQGFLIPLAAHETAHQWWYGLVGNNQATEPWLDESLSVYSEVLFYEKYYPDLTDWWWKYRVLRYRPVGRTGSTIYEHDTDRAYVNAIYLRGALFLDELRRIIGDEAFFAFLQDYATQNSHRQASSEQFFALLATHSSAELSGLRERYFPP